MAAAIRSLVVSTAKMLGMTAKDGDRSGKDCDALAHWAVTHPTCVVFSTADLIDGYVARVVCRDEFMYFNEVNSHSAFKLRSFLERLQAAPPGPTTPLRVCDICYQRCTVTSHECSACNFVTCRTCINQQLVHRGNSFPCPQCRMTEDFVSVPATPRTVLFHDLLDKLGGHLHEAQAAADAPKVKLLTKYMRTLLGALGEGGEGGK